MDIGAPASRPLFREDRGVGVAQSKSGHSQIDATLWDRLIKSGNDAEERWHTSHDLYRTGRRRRSRWVA